MRRGSRGASVVLVTTVVLLGACAGDDGDVADGPGDGASATSGTGTGTQPPAAATGDPRVTVEVSTLDGGGCPDDTVDAAHPDVVGARLAPVEGEPGVWRVSATLCSRYDDATRYADAWRVVTPDGDVLGTRELLHDHAGEQPFTRSLPEPVRLPEGVTTVVLEGRDLVNGWGGATLAVELD